MGRKNRISALQRVKVYLSDAEGILCDYTLKAREILFEKSLQYLVEHCGYPETVKEVKYEAAYLNGHFWIHKYFCCVADSANYFFGLLNIRERPLDYLALLKTVDVKKDLEQLRNSLEASVISAAFEKTYRSTPKLARDIFEKCKNKEHGSAIREKLVTDCRQALNYAMYECPEIRSAIMANPSEYLVRKKFIVCVDRIRSKGRMYVLRSEYDFHYTSAIMSYVMNDSKWTNRFSLVIVGCTDRWMDISCTDKFLSINERTGEAIQSEIKGLRTGRVYTGGSAELLRRRMLVNPSEISYQSTNAIATEKVGNLKWDHELLDVPETECPGWNSRVETTRPTYMRPSRSDRILSMIEKMMAGEDVDTAEYEDTESEKEEEAESEVEEDSGSEEGEYTESEDEEDADVEDEYDNSEDAHEPMQDNVTEEEKETSKVEIVAILPTFMAEDPASEFDPLSQSMKDVSGGAIEEKVAEFEVDIGVPEDFVADLKEDGIIPDFIRGPLSLITYMSILTVFSAIFAFLLFELSL